MGEGTIRSGEQREMDRAVYRIVIEELEAVGGAAVAEVEQAPAGGMLFTTVKPRRPGAASLDVAYQDDSTLNLTVGNIWFEIFGDVQDNLDYLRETVAAVFAGRVEECGRPSNAFGRIYSSSGRVSAGAMHLPVPWTWRTRRQYVAYSEQVMPLPACARCRAERDQRRDCHQSCRRG